MRADRLARALALLTATACTGSGLRAAETPVGTSTTAPEPAVATPHAEPAPEPAPTPTPALEKDARSDPTPALQHPSPELLPAEPARVAPSKRASALDDDAFMRELLGGGGAALQDVLRTPEQYRFQVLYGEVVTTNGKPALTRHAYRVDAEYFFPASSMKVPIALAVYDRLAALRKKMPELGRDVTLRIHPLSGSGEPLSTTLARETKRALVVSDNASANRLLAFVGHREAHEILWSLGLRSARIRGGFSASAELVPVDVSPEIDVVVAGGTPRRLPSRRSDLAVPPTDATGLMLGVANIVDGRRVEGPLSFAEKNAMKLRELQDTLVRIIRPDLLASIAHPSAGRATTKPRHDPASPDDLDHLRQALGTLPSESGIAGYDRNVVADYQLLPFLRGIERVRPRGRFQIHSKVGQAYGFLVHNAYVVDKDTGRSFFLTATIYANPNEVVNDDIYAYDTISFPVLADVGEVVARHAFAN
jgi:hypothetical protein